MADKDKTPDEAPQRPTEKLYMATVQLVVVGRDAEEALNSISGVMNHEVATLPVIDWAFAKFGGQPLFPTEIMHSFEDYDEGDAWD